MQIRYYAKFNDPRKIQVGTNVLTQAECYDNLDKDYINSTKTRVYLSYCLCLPLIFIVILVTVVRSLKVPIINKVSNSLNHPSIAGLVLTGIFIHLFCLAMDIAALLASRHSSYIYVTVLTLAFNMVISTLLIICSAYIHFKHILDSKGCLFEQVFRRVLSPIFYVVFGEFDQDDFWESTYKGETEQTDNDRINIRQHTVWVVCFMLLAPLFSFFSHIGYIFAAWLTEPAQTTSVALIFLGITAFLFITFRQCYIANEKVKVTKCLNWLILCCPCVQVLKCMCNCVCLFLCMNTLFRQEKKKPSGNLLEEEQPENTDEPTVKVEPKKGGLRLIDLPTIENLTRGEVKVDQFFNTQSFCVTFAWGLPLVGSVAFLLSAFYELPVASYTLPLYLLNAFQVFIVIITLLITYKVLQITEPALHAFLRNMKEAYLKRVQRLKVAEEGRVQMKGGEVESTAMLIGELAGVVVHELQKSKPSLSKKEDLISTEPNASPAGDEVNGGTPQEFPASEDSSGLARSAPHSYLGDTFTRADVHYGSTDTGTTASIRSSRKSSGSVSDTTPLLETNIVT
jgi:hypothetical protein